MLEHERNNSFSFLDVKICRENNKLTTSVYRKPTFSGVFTSFKSFIPTIYKFGLVYTKSTGKHLCQGLFLIKLQVSTCNFIKKQTLTQAFSCEFCEIFKNIFFVEHFWVTASFQVSRKSISASQVIPSIAFKSYSLKTN